MAMILYLTTKRMDFTAMPVTSIAIGKEVRRRSGCHRKRTKFNPTGIYL